MNKKPKALWWCEPCTTNDMETPPSKCLHYHKVNNKRMCSISETKCTAIKYTPERKEK